MAENIILLINYLNKFSKNIIDITLNIFIYLSNIGII